MTKKDSPVKYHGPVDMMRCSAYPDLECVLFVFQDAGIGYDRARQALLQHYEKDQQGRYQSTSHPFDAMRRLSLNPISSSYLPLVVEAHFVDSQKRKELLTTAYNNDGYISIMWDGEGVQPKVKALSTIPKRPRYSVYRVNDIPLGSPSVVRSELRRCIMRALKRQSSADDDDNDNDNDYDDDDDDDDDDTEADKDINLCKTLVDVVIGYETSDAGIHPLYDGSFTVILDTTYYSFEPEFSFSLYGGVHTLSEPTRHFVYCRKCKALDSHVTYEIDCSVKGHSRIIQ